MGKAHIRILVGEAEGPLFLVAHMPYWKKGSHYHYNAIKKCHQMTINNRRKGWPC